MNPDVGAFGAVEEDALESQVFVGVGDVAVVVLLTVIRGFDAA